MENFLRLNCDTAHGAQSTVCSLTFQSQNFHKLENTLNVHGKSNSFAGTPMNSPRDHSVLLRPPQNWSLVYSTSTERERVTLDAKKNPLKVQLAEKGQKKFMHSYKLRSVMSLCWSRRLNPTLHQCIANPSLSQRPPARPPDRPPGVCVVFLPRQRQSCPNV